MARHTISFAIFLLTFFSLIPSGFSQGNQTSVSTNAGTNPSGPITTFQSATRMVTLDIVVKDRQGRHVTGLKAADFHVFEQSPAQGKERHEQRIAAFREIRVADLASQTVGEKHLPAGVYSNALVRNGEPAPATILLVDGLNTEVKHQAQVHVQMLRMLRSLPRDVPVAVFLFGGRLRMLQDFTTDPGLLQTALAKASSTAGEGLARLDPRDDPNAVSGEFDKLNLATTQSLPSAPQAGSQPNEIQRIPQRVVDAVKRFEQDTYAASMDMRVDQTIEALVSLGRHVAGYPGRKNLLWISTSFPVYLSPLIDDSAKQATETTGLEAAGIRNYGPKLQRLAGILSEAKVAVYPINPAGVQVPTLYEAGTRVREYSGRATGDTLRRETLMRGNEQDSMQILAEGTGGQVCSGSNDLAECVRKAVDDSSSFYEVAYYPEFRDWNGEYRKIMVKTTESGLHLAYRHGYFARREAVETANDQKAELQQAACDDYLNATSIAFSAESVPPDAPEMLKFYLTINSSGLTLLPTSDGGRELDLAVAVCTFDKKGGPFLFMSDPVHRKFNAKEYELLTTRGLPHVITLPGPKPPALRLLVRDIPSGRLGSVNVKLEEGTSVPEN